MKTMIQDRKIQSITILAEGENNVFSTYHAILSGESERRVNEANRIANEANRVLEEAERVLYEDQRTDAEIIRKGNEEERQTNENVRQTNEEAREANELVRKNNEAERESNEELRVLKDYQRGQDINEAKKEASEAKTIGIDALLLAENTHSNLLDLESRVGNTEHRLSETEQWVSEVEEIAKGATIGKSFGEYAELIDVLNATPLGVYSAGQHFYIKTLNVPDVWVYYAATEQSEYRPYVYESYEGLDEKFAKELIGGDDENESNLPQVGYYVLSALETQKVDLTDYVKKTEFESALGSYITDIDALLGGE